MESNIYSLESQKQFAIDIGIENGMPIKAIFVMLATVEAWYHQLRWLYSIGKVDPGSESIDEYVERIISYVVNHVPLLIPEFRGPYWKEYDMENPVLKEWFEDDLDANLVVCSLGLKINFRTPEFDDLVASAMVMGLAPKQFALATFDLLMRLARNSSRRDLVQEILLTSYRPTEIALHEETKSRYLASKQFYDGYLVDLAAELATFV